MLTEINATMKGYAALSYIAFTLIMSLSMPAMAQEKDTPTDAFTVQGDITNTYKVSIAMLNSMPQHEIKDVLITNHMGAAKETVHGLKGVLLKDVLEQAKLDTQNPKLYSAYYIACTAADGYKIVFSWNELFNNPVGDNVYIVTEKEGKKLQDMPGRISMISPTDKRTGRRAMKNINLIEIRHL